MESHILCSYTALVLGCLSFHSRDCMDEVSFLLPKSTGFKRLIMILEEFLLLQSNAQMMTEENFESILSIIALLKNEDEDNEDGKSSSSKPIVID